MKEIKMKKFLILGLLLLPFAAGCSSLWKKCADTTVPILDKDMIPVGNVQVKGKLVGEYALFPREALENPTPASPRPAAAKKPAVRPAKATPARTQDDKHRISYDGEIGIRTRCKQRFGGADVFPGRGGDWHTVHPEVTADGFLDPDVVGPILKQVEARNQARLAENPNLRLDQLEFVCFNLHSPIGERYAEHLTRDGKWALPTPSGAEPGGRLVLDNVVIVGEIANTADSDHEIGARIHAFAVIPH